MKKNKYKQLAKTESIKYSGTLLGILLNFECDYEKSLIDWSFEKQGRNLSVEMYAEVDTYDNYLRLITLLGNKDFVADGIFMNNDFQIISHFLKKMKLNHFLFDFMITECTIAYGDEDSHSEFVRYSGYGFTVNGKKHLLLEQGLANDKSTLSSKEVG